MQLRQRQETIESLNEILESRDQYKAERELIDQNTKLTEEINRLRKREYQLKSQLNGEQQKATKRRSKVDSGELNQLIINLDTKKNNLLKDFGTQDGRTRLTSMNKSDRKYRNKNYLKEHEKKRR